MKKIDLIFVYLIFYLGWLGSIRLATASYSSISLLFPLVLFGFLKVRNLLKPSSYKLVAVIFVLGIAVDAGLEYVGLVKFLVGSDTVLPVGLWSIWIMFALSIVPFARVIKFSNKVLFCLGMFTGPLCYKSGEYLGALEFLSPYALPFYAIFWALMFPIFINWGKRYS